MLKAVILIGGPQKGYYTQLLIRYTTRGISNHYFPGVILYNIYINLSLKYTVPNLFKYFSSSYLLTKCFRQSSK